MAHTSGQWVAEPADMFGDHNIVLADGEDRRAIAAVVSNLRPEGEVAANAHLIAAAPGLLEALAEARRIIAEIDDYQRRPERGEYGVECACCMGELLDDDHEAIARIDSALTKAKGEQTND